MTRFLRAILADVVVAAMALMVAGCASSTWREGRAIAEPPAPPREFRAVWVAAVANIDWPSKSGLSTEAQIAEMNGILDRAAALNLNAVILHVRPSCDALYSSPIEPWSEYLTGRQGAAPTPYYDPLYAWVRGAHQRGLELHAWFNPYRARHEGAKSPDAPNHISNTHPEIVRKFNGWEWLDPGEELTRKYTVGVILDVVRRYDIDGVHLDDYFYPYAEYLKGAGFPDEPTYARYIAGGGKLALGDWRRENVNLLIREIYQGIKRTRPQVKFGISPFGIWRPGNPKGVAGLDAYEKLYADAKLWLEKGWCDYLTPQLYWRIESKGQPYAKLLHWWAEQNALGRHVWAGNTLQWVKTGKAPWPVEEVVNQIESTRADGLASGSSSGNVFFSAVALMQDRGGINEVLKDGPYREGALVPASPWLARGPADLPAPEVGAVEAGNAVWVEWRSTGAAEPWLWGVWAHQASGWQFSVHAGSVKRLRIVPGPGGRVDEVRVFGVDRVGRTGSSAKATIMPEE